jgi:arginine N-succinyltransferase
MYLVRPVELADIPALVALAAVAAPGVHTLPKTRESIERSVERSIASFAAQVDIQSEESYVFVLESVADKAIHGSAAILATAGTNGTYFAFRNDVVQQVSRDLNISHSVHALTLCSELTAYSQLSSFFVRDMRNAGAEAALLSRARLLFAAIAPHRFGDRFFVSLAGVTDANGESPFWNALGRKFFQMDFLAAERVIEGARNRTLIVELMPHYPVYVPLLPGDAQAAMGQIHPEGELPFKLLTEEGFEADEYVDIFDGGPILQANNKSLRSLAGAVRRSVTLAADVADAGAAADEGAIQHYLIGNVDEKNFRVASVACGALEHVDTVALQPDTMHLLGVQAGEQVICVRL